MNRGAFKSEFTGPIKPEALKYGAGTLRKVLRFGRSYTIPIIFLLLLTVSDSAVGLINPLIYRNLINTGILKGNSQLVIEFAVLAGCVAVIDALLTFFQKRAAVRLGLKISLDLGKEVFAQIQRMPLAFFVRAKTGAIVHRLNDDISGVSDSFINIVSMAVSNIITVSLVLTAMFVLSWRITLASLVVVPIFIVVGRMISYRLRILTRERYRRTADKNHFTIERFNIGGALVAKLFGRPKEDVETFSQISSELCKVRFKATAYSTSLSVGLGLVASLAVAVLYGWGGTLAISGRLDVGTLVALVSFLLRLYSPLTALGNLQVEVLTALVAFERIFEVLEIDPLVKEKSGAVTIPSGPAKIEFQAVNFRYPAPAQVSRSSFESVTVLSELPGRQVLTDITFTAEPGQLVALVGLSGSGKTTVAQLAARLYDPVAGSVKINGCDLRDATLDSIRATIGMVTQDAHFFHDTVRSNLLYAKPDASVSELTDALRKAQILPVIEMLPQGIDTMIGERGHRLSGGEKQRLAIARVLLKSPRVVILDEATAHLDSASEQAIQTAFKAALAGRTSLVIAHRLSTVRNADCIIVVKHGSIIERGRHEELLELRGIYHHLYQTQLRGE